MAKQFTCAVVCMHDVGAPSGRVMLHGAFETHPLTFRNMGPGEQSVHGGGRVRQRVSRRRCAPSAVRRWCADPQSSPSIYDGEWSMRYVMAWLLGVPFSVIVLWYIVGHTACR